MLPKKCKKLPKVAKSCQKLPIVATSCQKLPQDNKSCQNLSKVTRGCRKLTKVDKSCQKLSKVATGCHKLAELRQVAKKCQKLPEVALPQAIKSWQKLPSSVPNTLIHILLTSADSLLISTDSLLTSTDSRLALYWLLLTLYWLCTDSTGSLEQSKLKAWWILIYHRPLSLLEHRSLSGANNIFSIALNGVLINWHQDILNWCLKIARNSHEIY